MAIYDRRFGLQQSMVDYLNQALPDISGIFRSTTPGPSTPTPVPVAPEPGLTPEQLALLYPQNVGDSDSYSVYNPDPTRVRTDYSPYTLRRAKERDLIGDDIYGYESETEMNKLMEMYPEYYEGKQLTGIPGAIQGYIQRSLPGQILSGLESMMPINERAILENQARGLGIYTDDIGRVVASPGNINTAQNIMAGYNLAKIDADTFAKRRATINKYMKDKAQKEAKLKALAEAEALILGDAATQAEKVIREKNIQRDRDRGVDVQKSSAIQSSTSGLGSIGSGGGSRARNEARTSSRVSGGERRAYGL